MCTVLVICSGKVHSAGNRCTKRLFWWWESLMGRD